MRNELTKEIVYKDDKDKKVSPAIYVGILILLVVNLACIYMCISNQLACQVALLRLIPVFLITFLFWYFLIRKAFKQAALHKKYWQSNSIIIVEDELVQPYIIRASSDNESDYGILRFLKRQDGEQNGIRTSMEEADKAKAGDLYYLVYFDCPEKIFLGIYRKDQWELSAELRPFIRDNY